MTPRAALHMSCTETYRAQRRLQVERRHVVGGGADPGVAQCCMNAVPLGRAADEEVVHVTGFVLRQLDEIAETELRIPLRGFTPALRPLVELRQEDAEER